MSNRDSSNHNDRENKSHSNRRSRPSSPRSERNYDDRHSRQRAGPSDMNYRNDRSSSNHGNQSSRYQSHHHQPSHYRNYQLEGNGNNQSRGRVEKRGRDRSSSQQSRKAPRRDEDGRGNEKLEIPLEFPRGMERRQRERENLFFDQITTRPVNQTSKIGEKVRGDQTVTLTANFFSVDRSNAKFSLHRYHVEFEPYSEHRGLRSYLIKNHKEKLGRFVYNGDKQLFLLQKFPQELTKLESQDKEEKKYQLTLKWTGEVLYTEGDFLAVLNVIARNALRGLDLQMVKRNFYDARAAIKIDEFRIEIWPGYQTSIRQHENEILMCCKLTNKVMRNVTVLKVIGDCKKLHNDRYQDAAAKMIIGQTVLTDYNNETYNIADIDWNSSPTSTFETKNGLVKFVDYYNTKYGKAIRDKKQPLLVVKLSARDIRAGKDKPILLVPELCRMTGITDEMRANNQLMRGMSERTRRTPQDMVKALNKFNKRLMESPKSVEVFQQSKLELGRSLVQFDGRRLAQQVIQFGDRRSVNLSQVGNKADWTNNQKMLRSESWKNWYFVYPTNQASTALNFLRSLSNIVNEFGIQFEQPHMIQVQGHQSQSYIEKIKDIMAKDPKFIMIVVPSTKADLYMAIKRTTLVCDSPVPVQVVTSQKMLSRNVNAIAKKIVIQVNCKIGGIPWTIDLKCSDIMIVGFDVSHSRSKSYGAMVASLNPSRNGGDFFSAVNEHSNGGQLSSHFGNNIVAALTKYLEANNNLPTRILIYRDGVGDGQIEYVVNQELDDIKSKVRAFYQRCKKAEPKFGFVIVNKQTNTRIMTVNIERGCYNNPLPGTVADDVITLHERYDFYLVSQLVTQGTVSPTYYNVLEDPFNHAKPEIMQSMTFKMCHLYFNWSGTVRIPSVVQYAKKLAFLVAEYLQREPSSNIKRENQLYFL